MISVNFVRWNKTQLWAVAITVWLPFVVSVANSRSADKLIADCKFWSCSCWFWARLLYGGMIEPGGDWAWNCSVGALDSAWEVWLWSRNKTDRCTCWSECLVTSVLVNSRCCQPRGGERQRNNLLQETYQTIQQIENKRGVRADCTGNEQECK